MIPRFIIKNLPKNPELIKALVEMGYEPGYSLPAGPNLQIIGHTILDAEALDKNKLYKIYSSSDPAVLSQAELQLKWSKGLPYTPVTVGAKQMIIHVNTLGIVMDYCLVPITEVKALHDSLKVFTADALVTHKPVINPKAYFLTLGCCDFSVNDFNNIMTAYHKLSETP